MASTERGVHEEREARFVEADLVGVAEMFDVERRAEEVAIRCEEVR